jgi:hypothetical protein
MTTPTMKGLSFTLCFGSYGGFHAKFNAQFWRLCLGWVALTVYFCDLENYITYLRKRP